MFYRNRYSFVFSLVLYALIFPESAHAYLDAGTGSYLIQLAVALVAGGLFMAKTFWRRLLSVFSRGRKRHTTDTPVISSRDKEPETPPSDQT